MGTEVLRPQDCLVRQPPLFRRPNNPSPNCSPRSNPNPSARPWRRAAATYGGRRRWDGSGKHGVVGRVAILKRGGDDAAAAAARKAEEGWEAAVFGAGRRLGPDHPDAIPKGLLRLRAAAAEEDGVDAYAGSAVPASPSPRALPLPRFPRRSEAAAAAEEEEATRALRRLLRLE